MDTVTPEYLATAQAEVGAAQAVLERATAAKRDADLRASDAAAAFAAINAQIEGLDAGTRAAQAQVERARARIREFAVNTYVNGGIASQVSVLMGAESIGEFARRRALLDASLADGAGAVRAYTRSRSAMSTAALALNDRYQMAASAKAASDAADAAAATDLSQATAGLAAKHSLVSLVQAALPAGSSDIPGLMLDVYTRAAARVNGQGCALAWWAVAAIGKVESDHGREDGAHLSLNGDVTPPIVGPALDGTNGTQAIPASDGGRYSGDPRWEHAVGPMQFLPSTWREWGTDGNADGTADPNNAYDSGVAAARLLCAASGDVQSDAGLRAAYHAYNHDDAYVDEVLAFAHIYRGG